MNIIVFTIVSLLHNLFTAIWIGGMVVLAFAVLPSIKGSMGMGPEAKKLIDTIRDRLSRLIYVAFIVLILTGVLMSNSSSEFAGFFSLATPYSTALTIKHLIVASMIVISLLRSLVIPRQQMDEKKRMKVMMLLLLTNIVLGIGVLAVSSYLAALVRPAV